MSKVRSKTTRFACRVPALTAALAGALLLPTTSQAFFQQTRLEGTVGSDIGGVWLSSQQVMPEFRINFPKPTDGTPPVPVKVGPIPADLEPLTGKNPAGVSIVDCGSSGFCADNGLVVGDILIRVNSTELTDTASFEKAVENLPPQVMLSVRRPALRNSTARLMKIKYDREGKETSEGSIVQEKLDIRVLDVKLPFAADLEATRLSHQFYVPSAELLEKLGKNWSDVPNNEPLFLFRGDHRFVARSDFDEALSEDAALRKASHAIVMDMDGNPGAGGGKVIDIYGIESIGKDVIEGNYVTVTIASAPFPINVEFKGRFRMTRIADWSNADEKKQAAADAKKPAEDLSKFKTLPDVPAPAPKK